MFISITLKLPAKLKVRIARAAKQKGQSTQRWLREAIEHEVGRRERFRAYVQQARRKDADNRSMEEIDVRNRVRVWVDEISTGKRVTRMAPRRVR